jgi:hypothetical protein
VHQNGAPRGAATVSHGPRAQETNAPTRHWPRFLDDRSSWSLPWLIAFSIAIAYLFLFILRLPKIIELSTWNSDVASAFTIPATLVQTGTGGHTELASTGAYVELWFGLLTASLPLHRLLWEIAAPATFLATALTVGWSVSRVSTRRAAVLAVLLSLVISTPAFTIFMAAATITRSIWVRRCSAPTSYG